MTLHTRNCPSWRCTCTHMLSIYGADKEDDQLEDAEHQSVLRSTGSFPLGLQVLTQVTKLPSFIQKMGVAGVSGMSEHGVVLLTVYRRFAEPQLLLLWSSCVSVVCFGSNWVNTWRCNLRSPKAVYCKILLCSVAVLYLFRQRVEGKGETGEIVVE